MFDKIPFKYKILLIPALAILGFLIIVIMIQSFAAKNEDLLSRIQSGHTPALEMNRDLLENIEIVNELVQKNLCLRI